MSSTMLVLIVSLSVAFTLPGFARGGREGKGRSSFHSSRRQASKKSHVSGSHDGTFQGSHGSSHKGGQYKNRKTSSHYRNRKSGTPQ